MGGGPLVKIRGWVGGYTTQPNSTQTVPNFTKIKLYTVHKLIIFHLSFIQHKGVPSADM